MGRSLLAPTATTMVFAAFVALFLQPSTAQFGTFPSEPWLPCSSAPTMAQVEYCVLNETFKHLYLELEENWLGVMDTLADNAYELYVPTMMGGIKNVSYNSDQSLYYMYTHIDFVRQPESYVNILLDQTVGRDSIVFRIIVQFNHTENFWMCPYPPTYKFVSFPQVLAIKLDENNKLIYEQFYWDQASVLAQLGILDNGYGRYFNNLTEPYPGETACKQRLPVVGTEPTDVLLQGHGTNLIFNQFFQPGPPASTSPSSSSPSPSPIGGPTKRQTQPAHQSLLDSMDSETIKRNTFKSMHDLVKASLRKAEEAVRQESEELERKRAEERERLRREIEAEYYAARA